MEMGGSTHEPICQIIFVLDICVWVVWSLDIVSIVRPDLADLSLLQLCAQVHHRVSNALICVCNVFFLLTSDGIC